MVDEKVKGYFDKTAKEYDGFFKENPKMNIVQKVGHLLFRKRYVYKRLNAVVSMCGDVRGKAVLEVGCGSGQYSVELAKRGADVTGIDIAPNMIQVSRRLAESDGVKNCRFVLSDVFDFKGGKYDVVVCSGVFDYVPGDKSQKLLDRLKSLSEGVVVMTYPKLWNVQVPVRKAWLLWRGLPVYFYTKKRVSEMFKKAGLKEDAEVDIGPLVIKKGLV
jgi:magnesium-protoporphyrin O-methyltransferase